MIVCAISSSVVYADLLNDDEFHMSVSSSYYMVAAKTDLKVTEVMAIAHFESRGNPKAISPTGAKGLYQFTNYTWNNLNKKFKLGFGDKSTFNIRQQSIMMIMLTNDNMRIFKRWNKITKKKAAINLCSIYLAHNIGVWNAWKVMQLDDKYTIDTVIPDRILRANHGVYWCGHGKYCNKTQTMKKIKELLDLN